VVGAVVPVAGVVAGGVAGVLVGVDGLGPGAGVDCTAPILTYTLYFLHVLDHHRLALLERVLAFLTKSESGP
jgi:hypothetical protein